MNCTFQQVGFCLRRKKTKHQCVNPGCKNIAYTNNPSSEIQGNCWSDRSRPGDRLKAIFRAIGIDQKGGCRCDEHARLMNSWGTERCRREIETIVGWLEQASRERRLPFIRVVAKSIVKRAIRQAEREG